MHPIVMADLAPERHTELLRNAALVRRARQQAATRAIREGLRHLVPVRRHAAPTACCA